MSSKTIDVKCPCCSTVLTIDVLTRKVLRSAKVEEGGATRVDSSRWDQAVGNVEARRKTADDLDLILEQERERRSSLDDLFDQAKDRVQHRSLDDDEDDSSEM